MPSYRKKPKKSLSTAETSPSKKRKDYPINDLDEVSHSKKLLTEQTRYDKVNKMIKVDKMIKQSQQDKHDFSWKIVTFDEFD